LPITELKIISSLALSLYGKARLHGSKHGNPASAEAAKPQGTNDQFFAGPDP
jgi:hypothetical protein